MKNAATGIGLAVLGLGIAINGLSINSNQANAAPAANAGPAEPVIVAFGSLGGASVNGWQSGFYRLWSDSRIEVRLIELQRADNVPCGSYLIVNASNCPEFADTGWLTLPEPPGGNGFACRSDINGDRQIDAQDLGLLIAGWAQEISCDPQPSYPCFDLNGLNMNIAAR